MKKLIYSLAVVFLLAGGNMAHAQIPTCSVGQSPALNAAGQWYCQTDPSTAPVNSTTVNPLPQNPNAFCSGGSCTYTPLEPLPGLPTTYGPNQGSFGGLIASSFKLILGAGAAIAVVMLVIGALTYMFSDIVGNKTKALARIRGAMWAIVLLVSSYLILNTINPDLVTFKLTLTSGTPVGQTINNTPGAAEAAAAATTNEQITQCQNQSSGSRVCTLSASPSGGSVCSCGTI